MHCAYHDIREKITEPPRWWDEYAVPRYCEFSPQQTANIYAVECALVEIRCQACGCRFDVCFSWDAFSFQWNEDGTCWVQPHDLMTPDRIAQLHYGDPPNGCCPMGATMNCIDVRVLEFWRTHNHEYTEERDGHTVVTDAKKYFEWRRVPELELIIE